MSFKIVPGMPEAEGCGVVWPQEPSRLRRVGEGWAPAGPERWRRAGRPRASRAGQLAAGCRAPTGRAEGPDRQAGPAHLLHGPCSRGTRVHAGDGKFVQVKALLPLWAPAPLYGARAGTAAPLTAKQPFGKQRHLLLRTGLEST